MCREIRYEQTTVSLPNCEQSKNDKSFNEKNSSHNSDSILELQNRLENSVFNKKMFPNVCKHHLIIYGCLKFTFKKVWRIRKRKKIKIWNVFFCVCVKSQDYLIPDIYRSPLLSRNRNIGNQKLFATEGPSVEQTQELSVMILMDLSTL